MRPFFGDTFFFLALLVEGDDAHDRAVRIIEELNRELLTTTAVLMELGNGLSQVATRPAFVSCLEFLRSHPKISIFSVTDDLFDRGVALYAERPDKDWSLTDCISFIVMQDHGLTEALTGDHHFEQAGFVALLK